MYFFDDAKTKVINRNAPFAKSYYPTIAAIKQLTDYTIKLYD